MYTRVDTRGFAQWNVDFNVRFSARVVAAKKCPAATGFNFDFYPRYFEVVTDIQAAIIEQVIELERLLIAMLDNEATAPHEDKIRSHMQIAESHLAQMELLIGWNGKSN